MTFTRFVEVGRVVLINYGENKGKICTVIDVVDAKRVLVDGPQSITGIHRQVLTLKRLSLTDVLITKLPRNATQKNLTKAWTEQDVLATWEKSSWAKKLESKKRRAAMTDFDRFKLMIAKKQKSVIVAAKIAEMSK